MAVTAWTAGTKITAAKLAAITPIWTSWTPVWTTSTGLNTPAFGNATLACSYIQTGDLVICKFDIGFGSTTTFGGGGTGDNWRFSVPVTSTGASQTAGFMETCYDGSGSHSLMGRVRLTTTTTVEVQTASGEFDGAAATNPGLVDLLSPGTWTTSGYLRGTITYQAA
jgi:hypothetical protein